jgi:CheY-like chemotaxis protein
MEQAPTLKAEQKTLLIVDDDERILMFVSGLMVASNYSVLMARNGQEAIDQSTGYKGDISLLLSDFQMPGMSGVDLAIRLTLDRPLLNVLPMSDFPDGMLVLNEGWHFLAKPFIPSQLRVLVAGLVSPGAPSEF